MDFVPGALVAGRYRLRRMVGAGGMGEVWAGEDVKSGDKVAVKHLLPTAAKHHEVVARFKREAFLLGRIESEYVARVIDFFDDETYGLVLVMEFIEGPSLAHILEQRTLSVEEAVDLAVDLLRALQQLHGAKIVHRDLKPGNIIMRPTSEGRPRAMVVDFGISRLLPGKGENEVTGITRANIALGTVEYMAPEQILNSRDVTPVTDLYAVGIILFRAVKGHHAFGERRGEDLARAKLIEDAPALESGRRDDLALGLTSLIARALKKKPSQRFPSAVDMLAEVEALQERAAQVLDLDDATTDSGETAIKRSPFAIDDDDGPGTLARAPAGSAPGLPPLKAGERHPAFVDAPAPTSKVELRPRPVPLPPPSLPRPSAPPTPPTRPSMSSMDAIGDDEAKRIASLARGSMPSQPESGPRAALPSLHDSNPRGSMPSAPEGVRPPSMSDREAAPRPSLSSIADFGPSEPPVLSAARPEHTLERGVPLSKGTIALAILTSFAVGAAVGLIVAPTQAPASRAETCPPCASQALAVATATAAAPATPALAPAVNIATEETSASRSEATDSSDASATPISAPKPKLTGRMPTAAPTTTAKSTATLEPPSDGLGEDDPPKPARTQAPPAATPGAGPGSPPGTSPGSTPGSTPGTSPGSTPRTSPGSTSTSDLRPQL